jgi:2-oxoglutarate dehydrogenase E2 component (dihydrolipoamide succinyltransferase)
MSIQLKVPSIGESITEATVGAWLKREGDPVRLDEPVVEVESEKATVALPAPAAGVLRRVLHKTGDTVTIGEVLAELDDAAGARTNGAQAAAVATTPGAGAGPAAPPTPGAGSAAKTSSRPTATAAPAPEEAAGERRGAARSPETGERAESSTGLQQLTPPPAHPARIPPSARRLLAEHGLPAERVQAAVPGAPIRREDVVRALEAPAPAPAPRGDGAGAPLASERVVAMTPLRRTVARRLVEAQHAAAILTTFNEVDMSQVLALRERHGEAFLARHGVKLGFMSFFVKAAVEALRAFPAVNAEIRGTDVVYKDHYDIGVAVGGGKGLVVPVVRGADALSFAEIEKAIGDLARKARENRITMDDLAGGTFTISNGGIYGSLLSTPILNPPQSGILGLHKIEKRAVVREGDRIEARPMMYLALSYDHRIVDGREAVSFLVKVKEGIEDPERLLLDL